MANGGAGSRGGFSKSTFYRQWREGQLRREGGDDHGPYQLHYGIKRADLERVLQEEQEAREAERKAVTISYPGPTLKELLERGASPLRAWREVRGMAVAEIEAATDVWISLEEDLWPTDKAPTQAIKVAAQLGIEIQLETMWSKIPFHWPALGEQTSSTTEYLQMLLEAYAQYAVPSDSDA